MVSGFVFDKEDFVRPWEGQNDNLERFNFLSSIYESSLYKVFTIIHESRHILGSVDSRLLVQFVFNFCQFFFFK